MKTPREIYEYKMSWDPKYEVETHVNSLTCAESWCKKNLSKEDWYYKKHTNVFSNTFIFGDKKIATNFRNYIDSDLSKL
jgi:hypothetical protein